MIPVPASELCMATSSNKATITAVNLLDAMTFPARIVRVSNWMRKDLLC